jgi:hypothetical protein
MTFLNSGISVLAQIAEKGKLDSVTPHVEPASNAVTWIIVAVLVVAVLLIAFKGSKRNNMLEDQ